MAKYRCMNKECRNYYWIHYFPRHSEVEEENICPTCQTESILIPEEPSAIDETLFRL